MSHKNVTDEESRGLYETPRWPVHLLLDHGPQLPGGRWYEPCAGKGSICLAVNERRRDVDWYAVERDPELCDVLERLAMRREIARLERNDWFRACHEVPPGEVLIANPAFPDAVAFVLSGLALCTGVIVLERLDWLSGASRAPFFERNGAPDVYVLPNRPRFKGRKQDSGDYAWFVWGPGVDGRVRWLPVVSAAVRGEARAQLLLATDERIER